MIKNISIHNFKIHNNIDIELGGLTLLTGQNGMGKSSFLQALLLLRQSYNGFGPIQRANLKGDLVALGGVGDIECQSAKDDRLQIKLITSESGNMVFNFEYGLDEYDTSLAASSPQPTLDQLNTCPLFTNQFQYISAFRWGPQKGYERDTEIVQHHRQISKSNGQCEYAVYFLAYYGNKVKCHKNLVISEEGLPEDVSLISQVELWMRRVSPRVSIHIEQVEADYKLNYKFSREGQMFTRDMAAVNVGYGITYVLPILVAILSAEPGALILIENPEAHIHPKAQAELMKLVARAVKTGIQVVMETHSDHIVNGALVSVADGSLSAEEVKMYYFERDETSHVSVSHALEVQGDGRISNPPKGFFDQMDMDLRTIMGVL
jgi:predicted ATPase